jgi:hypothetical protein
MIFPNPSPPQMLLSLLHERFVRCSAPGVADVIPSTFAGKLEYRTTCLANKSHVCRSPAEDFYELVRWR